MRQTRNPGNERSGTPCDSRKTSIGKGVCILVDRLPITPLVIVETVDKANIVAKAIWTCSAGGRAGCPYLKHGRGTEHGRIANADSLVKVDC